MSDTATSPTRFTYDGHEVRVVTGPDSEPWFVATDVARALGYLNPADAVRRVDRRDRLQVVLAQGEGHLEVLRERAVVSEYGVYELVLGSPLPGAREFRHWVTHEVLPAVRRQAGAGGRPVPTAGTGPAHAPVLFESPEFGHVRTVEQDGRVLFCGRDVATALGYTNTKDALARHCKGVAIRYPLQTAGGVQQARFITEGDLYRLVTHSTLPSAGRFEQWVFDDVLPTVRRHGAYATPATIEAVLADPDTMIRVLTALRQELAARATAERQRDELADQAARSATKVLFADAVSASRSTVLVGDLAKILRGNGLDIGANRLFDLLRRHGYLVSRRGTDWNMPTQKAMELGLFKVKETVVTHSDGHVTVSRTPKVTGRGQAYLVPRILDGRIPVEDDARQTP